MEEICTESQNLVLSGILICLSLCLLISKMIKCTLRTLGTLRSLLTNDIIPFLHDRHSKRSSAEISSLRTQNPRKRGTLFPGYQQLLQRVPRQDLREHQCYYNPNGCF